MQVFEGQKGKFHQVEDMSGTQTLVNLVSIPNACKQDFPLQGYNSPAHSSSQFPKILRNRCFSIIPHLQLTLNQTNKNPSKCLVSQIFSTIFAENNRCTVTITIHTMIQKTSVHSHETIII